MALRQIMINRKINELEIERAALNAKITLTAERRDAWKNREDAAVTALDEMDENTSAEERSAFEAEAAEIETEDAAITAEENANATRSSEIETEITNLKTELADIEKRSKQPTKPTTNTTNIVTRKGENIYMSRFTREYRDRCADLATRAEVKEFIRDFRGLAERGITNTTLTIPTVMLPTLRERIDRYSKLSPLVNIKPIRGEGKQNLVGSVPEAIWTETTGKLNELSFSFAQAAVDGHKVAGYIPVPNPYLQDSDEDLAALVIDMLAQAIGLAKDKAILYGTGTNMPVGIVTRLTATTKPTWWGSKEPTFTNLSASNVGKLSATSVKGVAMLQEAFEVLRKAKPKYETGDDSKFWAMNSTTWDKIKIQTMSLNSAGAIVAGVDNNMPVIGGQVVTRDFIPENVIIGGYGGHYLLGERNGVELRRSEHVRFIEDQTVFAGVARYDGRPIAGEAFAAFSLDTTAITATAVTFAADTANAAEDTE